MVEVNIGIDQAFKSILNFCKYYIERSDTLEKKRVENNVRQIAADLAILSGLKRQHANTLLEIEQKWKWAADSSNVYGYTEEDAVRDGDAVEEAVKEQIGKIQGILGRIEEGLYSINPEWATKNIELAINLTTIISRKRWIYDTSIEASGIQSEERGYHATSLYPRSELQRVELGEIAALYTEEADKLERISIELAQTIE